MKQYVRIAQLASTPQHAGRWPVSPATIWRWCARGRLPAPVRLSPGVSAWPLDVIEEFEAAQAQTAGSTDRQRIAAAASVAVRRAAK